MQVTLTQTPTCGVPQGSVLNLLLTSSSPTSPVSLLADVTKLYVNFRANYDVDAYPARSRVKRGVVNIDKWGIIASCSY